MIASVVPVTSSGRGSGSARVRGGMRRRRSIAGMRGQAGADAFRPGRGWRRRWSSSAGAPTARGPWAGRAPGPRPWGAARPTRRTSPRAGRRVGRRAATVTSRISTLCVHPRCPVLRRLRVGGRRVVEGVRLAAGAQVAARLEVARDAQDAAEGRLPGPMLQSSTTSGVPSTSSVPRGSIHSAGSDCSRSKCAHQNGFVLARVVADRRREHPDAPAGPGRRRAPSAVARSSTTSGSSSAGSLDARPTADPVGAGPCASSQSRSRSVDSQSYRLYSPISSSFACQAVAFPASRRSHASAYSVIESVAVVTAPPRVSRAHVERFELLQRVRAAAHAQAAADRRVQVDQDPVAQQLVDGVLADAVAAREPEQRRPLVGGVVVDVHARVRGAALLDVGEEVDERLLLLRAVVRPERPERAVRPPPPRTGTPGPSPRARRPGPCRRSTAGRPRSRRRCRRRPAPAGR